MMVRARALPFPQGAGSQQGEALEDFGSFVLTIWRSFKQKHKPVPWGKR